MNPTVTKSKAGWRWEIGDGRFVGVCPTKEEAEAEALRWSIVLYAEAAEQRAVAAEAEVERVLADATILRTQAEATRAAAARERDRMRGNVDAWQARAEAAEQRAEALEREVARLRADCAILGDELSEANRLLLSGIPQQRGAKAERAAIACVLTGRAKTLRDRKALGAAEEVEALAFYIEQRGVAAEAQPAGEVSDG